MSLELNGFAVREDVWYGFRRRTFDFEGYEAWLVEPEKAAPGMPWTWCMEWPTAFVRRTGVPDLLACGFHHVHIKVPGYACDDALGVYRRYHEFLHSLGLSGKANLIGLSFGGLYSLRYAASDPGRIERIYLDAPVCSFHKRVENIKEAYHLTSEEDVSDDDPRMPVNLAGKLVKVPILLIYGADDLVVPPADNCELFAERFQRHGGSIQIIKRNLWGHHPHGLDDTVPIVEFFRPAETLKKEAES